MAIMPDNPLPKATFDRCVVATLTQARAILDQRSSEYLDTWSLDNIQTAFVDHALRLTMSHPATTIPRLKAFTRIVIMGSLCDVKISRLVGPFKSDTLVDLVNYISAFNTLVTEYIDAS